jgi:hypothetical protein
MTGIALDGADPDVIRRGVALLERFNAQAPRLLTQNFGVGIAVLLHRETPTAPTSGPDRALRRARLGAAVSTGALQVGICDATWEKDPAILPASATGPIYKPFTRHFKGRSPRVNNWRNSFDLQAGIGCDAPNEMLSDPTYLAEPRFDCRYRDRASGECRSPAGNVHATIRTCFNPNKRDVPPGPGTRAQHRPKLLARGVDSRGVAGYWAVDPTVDVLSDLLADPAKRVPVYPFAAALYGSSPYLSQWGTEVSRERLERDLALGAPEFMAMFDVDPASPMNAEMLQGFPPLSVQVPAAEPVPSPEAGDEDGSTAGEAAADEDEVEDEGLAAGGTGAQTAAYSTRPLSAPVPYQERASDELTTEAGRQADPARRRRLLERAKRGHRRTLAALATQLAGAGYEVDEQLDGYDLCGRREEHLAHLFEVKTWTPENLAGQVREGWAQLHEYRYRNRDRLPTDVRMYLVLDRQPPTDFWAWEYLAEEENVLPCWIAENALRTLPKYGLRLSLD